MGRRLLVCAVVLTALSSACGDGDAQKSVGAKPKAGGKIQIATAAPESLDPSKGSKPPALFVLKQICDTLVAFNPVTGELRPGAAESWTVAPDGKKVTFKLRPGVKFHNGRDVTADDYVYSLSRFVHQDNGSQSYFILSKVLGYRDVRDGRSDTLAGVHPLDPSTLEIELIEPFAELPAVLAHPAAGAAVPREEVDKDPAAFANKPVCTGPYEVAEAWAPGQDIMLVQAKAYAKGNKAYSRGGAGYAKEIGLRILPKAGPDTADIDTGYAWLIDAKVDAAEVPLNRLPGARRLDGPVADGSIGTIEYIGFPTQTAPYDNIGLRRSLSLAIDRKELVGDLLEGGPGVPLGLLPPAAGPAAKRSTCPSLKPEADKKTAVSTLQGSGTSGVAVRPTVFFNSGGQHDRWVREVTKSWESVLNIRSDLKPVPLDEYFKLLQNPGAEGPFRSAWPVRYPSAEALYGPLFEANSGDNFAKYSSEEFAKALAEARAQPDPKARADAYAKVGEILCRDLPIAPIWLYQTHVAFSEKVVSAAKGLLDIYGDPILRELGRTD